MIKMIRAFRLTAMLLALPTAPELASAGATVQDDIDGIAGGEPVSVETCVRIALEQNPSLQASLENVRVYERAVWGAYAVYLPSVGAGLDAYRIRSGVRLTAFGEVKENKFSLYSLNAITVQQTLFTYSGIKSISGARSRRGAERAGYEAAKQEVVFEVRRAYHNVLKTQDLLEVAKENLRVGEEQLKLAEKRREVGAGVIADVLKARAQVESNHLGVITAERNLADAKALLLNFLGLDVTLPIQLTKAATRAFEAPSYETNLLKAYGNRPDLRQWDLFLRAAHDGVGEGWGEWLPSVRGRFSYGWQANELSDRLFEDTQNEWSASISLSVPLFDAATVSRIQQRQAEARMAQWNRETVRQRIALEVQQAILSIEENSKKMEVAERNVVAAEEDLRVSQGKYRHGLVPILDLIEAQVALATARSEGVEAFHNYLTSIAALEKAIGEGE